MLTEDFGNNWLQLGTLAVLWVLIQWDHHTGKSPPSFCCICHITMNGLIGRILGVAKGVPMMNVFHECAN